MAKSAVRTMGTTLGKEILRGVLGSIFGAAASGADFKKIWQPTKTGRLPAQAPPGVLLSPQYAATRCMTSI